MPASHERRAATRPRPFRARPRRPSIRAGAKKARSPHVSGSLGRRQITIDAPRGRKAGAEPATRAPAASEPAHLERNLVVDDRLTHPPSVGSWPRLTKSPRWGMCGGGRPLPWESSRMACVAAAHVTRILKGGGGRSRLLSFLSRCRPRLSGAAARHPHQRTIASPARLRACP